MFSGIFLDATADESRAEVVPQAVNEVDAAAAEQEVSTPATQQCEESPSAAQTADTDEPAASEIDDVRNAIAATPLGGFIGFTPSISTVFVGTADAFTAAINNAVSGQLIILTNDITLGPTHIPVLTGGDASGPVYLNGNGHTISRTYSLNPNDARRHLYVDGGYLHVGGVIFCGISTGTFSMTENIVHYGGGIEVRNGGFLIFGCGMVYRPVEIRNSAAPRGGGILVRGGNVSNYVATIHNNAATLHGGGVYLCGFSADSFFTVFRSADFDFQGQSSVDIVDNRVEGRVWFEPVPLTPLAITALNNGTALRNWYTANGYGGADLTAPLPGRYDFPRNVSRGGGGVAVRSAGENLALFSNFGGNIRGNFAERGGGVYVTGDRTRFYFDSGRVADNSAHHSEFRSPSISPVNPGGGQPDGANPSPASDFDPAHRRASGSGGGIHASNNAVIDLTAGIAHVSRNISIADVSGVTTGGGGGIAVLNGATLNFTGGIIGGTTPAAANMLSNWEPCEPVRQGGVPTGAVIGGCTPNCHPNHPDRPATGTHATRNAGWSDLFPCVNGLREGYNRVGANRVGWASARGAHAHAIAHDGAGVFVYNATVNASSHAWIMHNRVCEAGNQTSGSSGGGIAVHGANSVVNLGWGARLTHNSAGLRGGGIYVANGTVNLNDNSLLAYNMVNVAGAGGGVAISGGTLNMNGTSTIRDHRYSNTTGGFGNGGGISVHALNGATVNMNDNSLVANNRANNNGGGVFMDSSSSGGLYTSPAPSPIHPVFTMNNNAQIRTNSANNGGGVAMIGHGNIFNMNNNAAIGARADGSAANVEAHRNTATNHGGGIFSTGNGNTINMSTGTGTGTAAIRGNHANQNGGGVLIGGSLHITRTGAPPSSPAGTLGQEVGRNYPTLNIGASAEITDNHARRTGTGTVVATTPQLLVGGGGGIYVGGISTALTQGSGANQITLTEEDRAGHAGVNLLGGTIARNQVGLTAPAGAQQNANGGGVFVRSFANGSNNSIAGLDNHFGFRAVSGTINNNSTVAGTTVPDTSGNGGGIFTMRYLHRSPLANNPLFEVPFVTQAQANDYIFRNYSTINISADTIFANNVAARRSFPPLGDQLPHVQWNPATGSSITYGQMPAASPAYANPPAASTALYILNNFDINYIRPNNDFWFVKEDLLGNPLPGALFRLNLNTPAGTAAPGSPAGTPTNTAAGERISLENGLVGFPLALSRYGPAQNYALTEVEVRNADGSINTAVVIPAGHWTFNLPNRITNVTSFTNSIAGEPAFDRNTGVVGHAHETTLGRLMWRVQNLLIQPATFSFFKTDMSIYDTPPNQSPPRLTGANFSLYRWTPQAGSAPYAASVTPAGIAAGHWTQVTNNIPSVAAESNAHIFNFVATSQDAHTWHTDGGTTIFHLVETTAPSGFDLPAGQWRFVLELDTTTGNAITPGHDHIRPALAPNSLAPAFIQPRIGQSPADTAWYVGNVQMITPTGVWLEASRTPFVLTVCAVAFFFAARGAVHARKRIEELPMIVPIKRK